MLRSKSNTSVTRRAAVSIALVTGCAIVTAKTGFAEEADAASISDGDLLAGLPNDPTYEQYLEFARNNLSEMPNPEGMACGEQTPLSARYSSPYWSSEGHGIKTFI